MQSTDLPVRYQRFNVNSGWEQHDARVIAEKTISLTVNGAVWLKFTCTPTDLEALAVGFLYNEGIFQKREEVIAVDICEQGTNVDVWLSHSVERPDTWQRTSGCTGGLTTLSPSPTPHARETGPLISPSVILSGMEQLLQAQELYRETGGVHCSALSDGERIRLRAEDIGRHNTLDKLAGRMLLDGMQFRAAIVLTTGRVSSEMLQKSDRLGAEMVVSRTSPTSQSVELAEALGITLIGYARRNGFLVYTHSERLARQYPPLFTLQP